MFEARKGGQAFQNCPNRRTIQNTVGPTNAEDNSFSIQCLKYPDSPSGDFKRSYIVYNPRWMGAQLGCLACAYRNESAELEQTLGMNPDGSVGEVVVLRRIAPPTATPEV